MGCRVKAPKATLLRVVAVGDTLVPDPAGRLPGRGASVHPDLRCVDLAEKRRAFPRALRLTGPLAVHPVREHVARQHLDQHEHDDQPHDDHDSRTPDGQPDESRHRLEQHSMSQPT